MHFIEGFMARKYADESHKAQAEEFIFELGAFVLAFERMCDVMRYNIMFMLREQGLKNQGMEQAIVGDKAAAELQVLMGALYCELPKQDKEDKKAIKGLLKTIKELTEQRNILLHSSWSLGNAAALSEFHAATVRYRAKQNTGADAELHGYSSAYVRELAGKAEQCQVLLQRLQSCIAQKGFKVETEFARSL